MFPVWSLFCQEDFNASVSPIIIQSVLWYKKCSPLFSGLNISTHTRGHSSFSSGPSSELATHNLQVNVSSVSIYQQDWLNINSLFFCLCQYLKNGLSFVNEEVALRHYVKVMPSWIGITKKNINILHLLHRITSKWSSQLHKELITVVFF